MVLPKLFQMTFNIVTRSKTWMAKFALTILSGMSMKIFTVKRERLLIGKLQD